MTRQTRTLIVITVVLVGIAIAMSQVSADDFSCPSTVCEGGTPANSSGNIEAVPLSCTSATKNCSCSGTGFCSGTSITCTSSDPDNPDECTAFSSDCFCDASPNCNVTGCPAGEVCDTGTGACVPGFVACSSNADCDDSNPCTNDICNDAGTTSSSCSNPQNGSCTAPSPTPTPQCTQHIGDPACDDSVACTSDVCQDGVCANLGSGCFCGDGSCTGGEDASNCLIDCGTVTPTPTPLVNNASCVSTTIPTTMTAGQVLAVSVTMNNNGTTSWISGGATPYRLGSSNPQNNSVWGLTRVSLPSTPINPGNNAVFSFNITAPAAGTYSNQWEMVQETVAWFGALCGPSTVSVVAPPQCSDGIDNDSDGLTDWPADPGCTGPTDPSEIDPLPVIDSFNATPASITSGNSSTLSWTTTNAMSATIDQGIGTVAVDGSHVVSPVSTTTYILTAVNGEGASTTGSTTVTVTNNPPSVSNVSVQEPDYCSVGPSATVNWQFNDPNVGDTQSAFQVQVDDSASFQSPVVDTGKILASAQSHFIGQGVLSFNTIYRLRVRVWDSADAVSGWQTMTGCTGPGCQPNNTAWRTPTHRYPSGVSFTHIPTLPQVNEIVQFTGGATCFDNNNNPTVCSVWQWLFGDGGTASVQNPTHAYGAAGSYQATLQVQDSIGLTCPVPPFSKTIQVKIRLPRWREVLPR